MKGGLKMSKLRNSFAIVCVVLAAFCLIAAVIVRYVQSNILNTDKYVEIVSPLPKDPAVSEALATFTTEKIFDNGFAEQKIQETLPEKLGGLAPIITRFLETETHDLTKKFVSSDGFTTVWVEVNRQAHQAVIKIADSEPGALKNNEHVQTVLNLDLSRLAGNVRDRLGDDQALISDETKDGLAQLNLDIGQTVNEIRQIKQAIDTAAIVLPIAAVVLFAAAIALAINHQKLILVVGIVVSAVGLIMLAAFALIWNQVQGTFTNPVYAQAADVIYQAFYSGLQSRLTLLVVVGVIIVIFAILFAPYKWTVSLRKKLHIPSIFKAKKK